MRVLALFLAALPIGHSVQGRAIRPVVLGDPGAAHRMLVVGCIHGNERAGIAIAKRLISTGLPAETDLWIITNLNPDGAAAGTRGNANGVTSTATSPGTGGGSPAPTTPGHGRSPSPRRESPTG